MSAIFCWIHWNLYIQPKQNKAQQKLVYAYLIVSTMNGIEFCVTCINTFPLIAKYFNYLTEQSFE